MYSMGMMIINNENNNYVGMYGTLVVRSKPSHAIVIVDDKKSITPVFFDLSERDLPYDVVIKKEGYIDYTQKIIIQSGSKLEITAVLKKNKRKMIFQGINR